MNIVRTLIIPRGAECEERVVLLCGGVANLESLDRMQSNVSPAVSLTAHVQPDHIQTPFRRHHLPLAFCNQFVDSVLHLCF